MKNTLKTIIVGFIAGVAGALVIVNNSQNSIPEEVTTERFSPVSMTGASDFTPTYRQQAERTLLPTDNFVTAAEKSTSSVVFIQTLNEVEYRTGGWMDWFFEPRSSQQVGSGSGVVFSQDGYIVTNNHVVLDADEIKVIAGKKTYAAELVGRDPSSDLAVIKINSSDLPVIEKGDSESVKVGEWVLAVGNPFNLTSTVTAGIVSAKGRNINILRDKFPIESFIQTDAAINPGNSGGALINSAGQLIGINTAILSRTGSYAGYGFAIPVNIVKKVFNDIVKYGEVQKAFAGAEFIDIDGDLSTRLDISDLDGVIIADVKKDGAADNAGLQKRDVIRKINSETIFSKANIEELIAKSYPGEQLDILIEREGKMINKNVVLTNRNGTTGIIKRDIFISEELEASFESVSKVERDLLGIASGVKVVDYKTNGFFSGMGIPKGFIIIQINNKTIDNPEELANALEKIRGRFDVIGIDSRGRKVYYPYRR